MARKRSVQDNPELNDAEQTRRTMFALMAAGMAAGAAAASATPAAAANKGKIRQADIANFAGLVAEAWRSDAVRKEYMANPTAVLARHGIRLPKGIPVPMIPAPPPGGEEAIIRGAWKDLNFDNWDLTISHLGGGAAGIAVSSLGCIACPFSSFSSLSNGVISSETSGASIAR